MKHVVIAVGCALMFVLTGCGGVEPEQVAVSSDRPNILLIVAAIWPLPTWVPSGAKSPRPILIIWREQACD